MTRSTPTPLDQLTELGARRRALQEQLGDLEAEMQEAAAYLDKSRVPRSVIADAAGVSPPTLRRWLAE